MRNFKIIGHLYFALLFILAVIFFKERIIYTDAANFIFKIINSGTFNFEVQRYGVALSQILPIIAIKLGSPLKLVLILYSISFVLVYYLVFLLCTYKLKNLGAGILVILITSLGIYHAYVHDVTETNQALVFIALFYAWLNFNWNEKLRKHKFLKYFGSALFIILCYYTHPASAFPILFVLGFYLIDQHEWKSPLPYLLILLVFILYTIKFFSIDKDSYEGGQISGLTNITNVTKDFFHLYSFQYFTLRIKHLYCFSTLIFVIVALNYTIRKEFFKLAFFVVSTFSFFFIIVINFYQGDSDMMMEKNFLPITIFIGIPFLKDVILNNEKWLLVKQLFLITTLAFAIILMIRIGNFYNTRINYLNNIITKCNNGSNQKFIVDKKMINSEIIIIDWGLSIETLLLSSLDGTSNSTTIFATDFASTSPALLNTEEFLYTPFWLVFPVNDLNKNYFSFKKEKYIVVNKL